MPPVAGAVLTGGSSRRMGRDKALADFAGRPLAAVAIDALRAAGADPVVTVGGDLAGLGRAGLVAIADLHPGEGPLGGIVTAMGWSPRPSTVVLSCDLPAVGEREVAALVGALAARPEADVAAAEVDGRPQYLAAAYRARAGRALSAAFAEGERAVRRAMTRCGLRVALVRGLDPDRLFDVDRPDELERAARLAAGPLERGDG
jgi:molybdopterin-guanine dinucleotide biosynthesis protein A